MRRPRLFDAALIAAVGTFWFEIPFRGSVLMLFAGVVVYIATIQRSAGGAAVLLYGAFLAN